MKDGCVRVWEQERTHHISQFTHQNKQYVGIDVHVSEPVRIGLSQSTKEERSLVEVYRGLVENHL